MAAKPNAQKFYDAGLKAQNSGRLAVAVKHYQACLKLVPNSPPVLNNLGFCLMSQGRNDLALKVLQRARSASPDDLTILGNLAACHRQLGEFEAARDCLLRRSQIDGSIETLRLLVAALRATVELDVALDVSEKISNAKGASLSDLSSTLHLARELCDWNRLAAFTEDLIAEKIKTDAAYAGSPFRYYSHLQDPDLLLEIARRAAKRVLDDNARATSETHNGRRARKSAAARIGFISQDFRDHPMLKLIAGLLETGPENDVEVYAYALGPDSDDARRTALKEKATVFRSFHDLTSKKAVDVIERDGLDALIDLMGYTRNARPEILAARPCPVQISWLGLPGTTGAAWIDHVIADDVVVPAELEPGFTENVIRMAPTYYPFDDRSPPVTPEPLRDQHGLPKDAFVFASFNQSFKFCPQRFHTWCEAMLAVPSTVLWLMEPSHPQAKTNIWKAASDNGVDPDRVVFAPRIPHVQHYSRLRCADLMLDTWLYGGHTTTIDALWAGVPVLTRIGPTFTSRVAASILSAANLEELIMQSEEEYFDLAVTLASDQGRYRALAKRCQNLDRKAAPFSTSGFNREFFRTVIAAVGEAC
ncbi:MAG: tetratricopeptide repeat protein [Pseudomonadota bacterium]